MISVSMITTPITIHISGDTYLDQGPSSSSGYIVMENKVVCGDIWDINAGKVVCKELGFGPPKEVFGADRYGSPKNEFQDLLPLCKGGEESLDSCKLSKNTDTCRHPAGVVCSRVTIDEDSILLDGLHVCTEGFTDAEASALCKEEGFHAGTVDPISEEAFSVPRGWSLKCKTANLDNCKKSLCIDGNRTEYTCGNGSEIELIGSADPGKVTILYRKGLVCDDAWDFNVSVGNKSFKTQN